jgi:hypothetical protein
MPSYRRPRSGSRGDYAASSAMRRDIEAAMDALLNAPTTQQTISSEEK